MTRHSLFVPLMLVFAALACGPVIAQPTAVIGVTDAAPIIADSPIASEQGATISPIALPSEAASASASETGSATPTETATATATFTPTSALPIRDGQLGSPHIEGLIAQVNGERLYNTVFTLANIHSRHVNSTTIADAAEFIAGQFGAAGGYLQVSYDTFPVVWNGIYTDQRNVVATLLGTDPSAGIIIVGAHYDSRTIDVNDATGAAPGANDNGSGTSVVIEAARVMANERPRATIVFIAFSAEEVGKLGSIHYVEQALARGDDIRQVIVMDTVGNAVGDQGEGMMRIFSADPAGSPSRRLAAYMQWQAEMRLMPHIDVQVQQAIDRPRRYSDHVPFSDVGIPAVRLIETLEELSRNHSSLDRPEHLSPRYMQMITQVVITALGNLAYAPNVPAAPVLANGSLTWQPVEGARGYLIALWEPEQPELRITHLVTEPVTSVDLAAIMGSTIPYSAVSIASIDVEGHVSFFSPELNLNP